MKPAYKKLIAYDAYLAGGRRVMSSSSVFFRPLDRLSRFALKYLHLSFSFFLSKVKTEPCDILLLATGMADIKMTQHLWTALKEKGYSIGTYTYDKKRFLKDAFLKKNTADKLTPYPLFMYESFARFLFKRFQPKLIISFFHHTPIPSFVRMHCNCPTIHLPHSFFPGTDIYSSFDFEYYLCFGEAASERILNHPLRVGSSKLLKCGSSIVKSNFHLAANAQCKAVILFSDWMPERGQGGDWFFEIVFNWIRTRPDIQLYVKLHPAERGELLKKYAEGIPNVQLLDRNTGMREALEPVSLCITTWSMASIEAAMMNRPSVSINTMPYNADSDNLFENDSVLQIEKYFGRRVQSAEHLNERVNEIFSNYDHYLSQCPLYVKHHLEYTTEAPDIIVQRIESIYHNKIDFEYTELQEKIPDEWR